MQVFALQVLKVMFIKKKYTSQAKEWQLKCKTSSLN